MEGLIWVHSLVRDSFYHGVVAGVRQLSPCVYRQDLQKNGHWCPVGFLLFVYPEAQRKE